MQLAMTARLAVLAGLVSLLAEASSVETSRMTVTPIQKVIQMLTQMKEKGMKEKQAEAVQFATYNQFCVDVIDEKDRAIKAGGQQKTKLQAEINDMTTRADTLQREVNELDNEMAVWQADIKAATTVRETERNDYTVAHQDYTETIDAITRAVAVLKSQNFNRKQAPAGVSLMSKMQGMDTPLEVAKREITAFLARDGQDPLDGEAYGYESRSTNIIDMIEQLKDKFVQERSDLEKAELNNRHAFEMEVQDLQKSVTNAKAERSAKVQEKARSTQKSSTAQGDLQDVVSTLADDTKYLSETKATCSQKQADFKERQLLRTDEISAIEKAIDILANNIVGSATATKMYGELAQVRSAPAFIALRSVDRSPSQLAVATYLSDQAERIHSRVLTALAVHAQQDPFTKVKKMIQDLIMRLMDEAGQEADQKAFCDKELADNKAQRDARTADVEKYQAQIDQNTAEVARLAQEIGEHTQQMALTDGEVAELTQMRQKDKAENEQTIADAKAAQTAVGQAVTVLKEFYDRSAQATALLQTQKQDPAAPPIFDEAYQGMGAEGGGVISMLEVIQSDYARLESTTSAMEATAQQDYDKQMSDAAVLKAQTSSDIKHKTSAKQNMEQSIVDDTNDLGSAQKELDAANTYYDKLKPQCVDTGVSFEDRAQRRQEEIQSLQEALRILNGEDITAQ